MQRTFRVSAQLEQCQWMQSILAVSSPLCDEQEGDFLGHLNGNLRTKITTSAQRFDSMAADLLSAFVGAALEGCRCLG